MLDRDVEDRGEGEGGVEEAIEEVQGDDQFGAGAEREHARVRCLGDDRR